MRTELEFLNSKVIKKKHTNHISNLSNLVQLSLLPTRKSDQFRLISKDFSDFFGIFVSNLTKCKAYNTS